jgi:hypothetical protein
MGENALAYHLADLLYQFTISQNSSLAQRKNLIASIFANIETRLRDEFERDEELNKELKELKRRVNTLHETYEIILDLSPYVFEKKILYEIYLYDVYSSCLRWIDDYDLVSPRVLEEVYASRWGGRDDWR